MGVPLAIVLVPVLLFAITQGTSAVDVCLRRAEITIDPTNLRVQSDGPIFNRTMQWPCDQIVGVSVPDAVTRTVTLELVDGQTAIVLRTARRREARECADQVRQALGLPRDSKHAGAE